MIGAYKRYTLRRDLFRRFTSIRESTGAQLKLVTEAYGVLSIFAVLPQMSIAEFNQLYPAYAYIDNGGDIVPTLRFELLKSTDSDVLDCVRDLFNKWSSKQ
ncbi:hypothetical protein [Citrobacter amalonaticus]|uniref:Uncharacterized protein n=1 Tax=Citrobacter amalonaticus TaxID=35703 RepID=A0AAX2BNT8_CITAM|nr:hypothetical protein [Citrobacter amalonaticus]SBA20774.1 protein of unknown function [Citrobacter amalonaticus]